MPLKCLDAQLYIFAPELSQQWVPTTSGRGVLLTYNLRCCQSLSSLLCSNITLFTCLNLFCLFVWGAIWLVVFVFISQWTPKDNMLHKPHKTWWFGRMMINVWISEKILSDEPLWSLGPIYNQIPGCLTSILDLSFSSFCLHLLRESESFNPQVIRGIFAEQKY